MMGFGRMGGLFSAIGLMLSSGAAHMAEAMTSMQPVRYPNPYQVGQRRKGGSNAATRRAAAKARNQARHRRAQRGARSC